MKFLVVGSGGREHAIIKKLIENHTVGCVSTWINPGIKSIVSYYHITTDIVGDIITIYNALHPDIVFIGPEQPIVDGISDICLDNLIPCIAPLKDMALIESSKSQARNLLFSIPELSKYNPIILDGIQNSICSLDYTQTSNQTSINTSFQDVYDSFITKVDQYVIKCDGLKGGKGVYVQGDHFNTHGEGSQIIDKIKKTDNFILEEKLVGEEFSVFTFSDGIHYQHSPPIKDYKRAYSGDTGPNTGGMGSISVYDNNSYLFNFLTDKDLAEAQFINETVLRKFKETDVVGYVGILYGSFMKTENGIKVIEFNCRFGDSEAINVMELLDTDLGEIFHAMVETQLDNILIRWKKINTVVKYIVPAGYPTKPNKCTIQYNDTIKNHMSIANIELTLKGRYALLGSRSIAFIGTGNTLKKASHECEQHINSFISSIIPINNSNACPKNIFFWRSDIGASYENVPNYIKPDIIDYKSSGVDITKNDSLVERIKPVVELTYNDAVIGKHGSFGGQFILKQSLKYNDNPVLVSSTDGVGTKGIFAYDNFGLSGLYNCGYDIVNHCINDILVMGAYPLFFLDYYASSNLNIDHAASFIAGCADSCKEADCVLSGGETAEMPNVYKDNCFDLVGTIVGIRKIDVGKPQSGDVVIRFKSSGPHTNGYSLIRKCVTKFKPPYEVLHDFSMPHKSYLNEIQQINNYSPTIIHGMCHITGGGINNINRILPDNLTINKSDLDIPKWCEWIQNTSGMSTEDMYKTFNMGTGFLVIIDKNQYDDFVETIDLQYDIYGTILEIS